MEIYKKKLTPEDFRLVIPIQARFRDTDMMGHINNAVYLSYLELARVEYWKAVAGSLDFSKTSFILARVEIDYKIPATLRDPLSVGIRVQRIGGASFNNEYAVFSGAQVAAVAKTVQVMYDYTTSKPIRMPQEYRSRIEQFEGRKFHAET